MRPTVPEMDEILGHTFPVLDKGFIRVIDYMGDDAAIVQAARVSYGDGTKSVSEDRGLIRYLMRHRHTSPFEMCEIKLHVRMPIFIARQWIRHRTANVNEYSGRYSVMTGDRFEPPALRLQSAENKQGSSDEAISDQGAVKMVGALAQATYDHLLAADVSREQARMVLPLNTYTEMYWKIDLHNLLHFLGLRADSHAQAEIRAYADQIMRILEKWVPLTMEAFRDYRLNAVTLSAQQAEAVKRLFRGQTPDMTKMTKREMAELAKALDINHMTV